MPSIIRLIATLKALNVYGNNFPITKEECVNHVSKRLGTGLGNAVKVCKAKGITLGGRSDGSLTEVKIVKLTKYYKNSVLRNLESVVNMKQDILATLHHCVSTDSTPRHKMPSRRAKLVFFQPGNR